MLIKSRDVKCSVDSFNDINGSVTPDVHMYNIICVLYTCTCII